MDASIKGDNIRTFVRLLQCASKYGDDLNIHANFKLWEMSVTNSSKSAFCLFKLEKSFFCRWEAKSRRGVKCRLLVKSVLAVLGKVSQISTVNRVDLRIIDPSDDLHPPQHKKTNQRQRERGRRDSSSALPRNTSDDDTDHGGRGRQEDERKFGDEDDWEESDDARVGIEAKLVMRLVCKHGVTKKHSLHLGSSDFLRADVDPNTTPSGFIIATRTLRDWLDHFSIITGSGPSSNGYNPNNNSGGTNQLGWMFTRNEVRVKSWEGMGGGGLSTEIKVDVDEFQDYEITDARVDLTLPMKEFKATLVLAEQLSATLNVSFSEPGQPLTLTSIEEEFDDFSIFCAIATTVCEAFLDVRQQQGSTEIKRSNSDARSRTTTESQMSHISRRRGSETPSQVRKKSTLNLTPAVAHEEPLATVHMPMPRSTSTNSRIGNPSTSESQRMDPNYTHDVGNEDGDVDMAYFDGYRGGNASHRQEESLFLPGGSQNDDGEDDNDGPPRTQTVQMTQEEVLEHAGLGGLDMDDLGLELTAADNEDEEEERITSQRPQPAEQDLQHRDSDVFLRQSQGDQLVATTRTPGQGQGSAGTADESQGQISASKEGENRIGRSSMSSGLVRNPASGRSEERERVRAGSSKLSSGSGEKSNTSHLDHAPHSISDTSNGKSRSSNAPEQHPHMDTEEFEDNGDIDWSDGFDPALSASLQANRHGTEDHAGDENERGQGRLSGHGHEVQMEEEDEMDEDEYPPTQQFSGNGSDHNIKRFKSLLSDEY